jgi:LppX/LprAFG-like lipoprotein
VRITSSTTPEGLAESGSMTFDDSGRASGVINVKGLSNGRAAKLTAIADGTRSFISSDALDSIPEGKKWMELDLSSAASNAESSAAEGPKEGLKILESVQSAEKLGQEDINGVPTTHYRGTFPAAEEVFGVKVDTSDRHVDVWIDAQDRVRRTHVVLDSALNDVEESAVTTEMTIDYLTFGRVPKIELPNPDEVFNATSEIESQVQEAAGSD